MSSEVDGLLVAAVVDLCTLAGVAPQTEVFWASRTGDLTRAYGGGSADQLPERAALGQHLRRLVTTGAVTVLAPFAVDALRETADGRIEVIWRDGQREQSH